ncbi:RagB/SusD family nutrient uptake outer membrane protein [Allomuricauda sp. F6463D]|uniref:RagB/SusD family nutrient uptake outer membrane protein n=1 Tax=Allomuricauda sp. F6463D TaxID=2926409 RepID=UPI001FF6F98B|nr:RagB/SusD family nutrient uptake outer membrane protein [Muricauda sp. F6463D]MCK0159871.1 RagB/SusD family nutrient uptake outer membrane protein [Muricauda sp. F6463D]
MYKILIMNGKNFSKFLPFLGLLIITACDDILERTPENQVEEAAVVTDETSANAAVNGMYNELQSSDYYGDNFLIMSDVSSDIAQSIGTWDFYREMDTYEVSAAGNTENDNFYKRANSTINMANNVLDKVAALEDIPEDSKDAMLGAAYFVRALALFDLNRVYGGVPGVVGTMGMPVIREATGSIEDITYPERPALLDSYLAVEEDLLSAEELLPETDDKTVASKGAARALLSRLYLYLGYYEDVITYSSDVITDSNYTLNPDFFDIFDTKSNQESIFELDFNSSDQSGIRNWYNPNGGRGDLTSHEAFYLEATADPLDVRGQLFGFSESNGHFQTKYQKAGGLDNIYIIRIAEMYLNRAEALAQMEELDDAIDDLNEVRTRAGVDEITTTPSTKEEVLELIWNERKLEFAFEGHRFFDLARTGQIMDVLQNIDRMNGPAVSIPEIGRAVFPIPRFELDANPNMEQNEAYR